MSTDGGIRAGGRVEFVIVRGCVSLQNSVEASRATSEELCQHSDGHGRPWRDHSDVLYGIAG